MQDAIDKLKLYEHNIISYNKIRDTFNTEENIALIVHATGTGKTYNALALALENKTKDFLYVVPTNAIIEHIKEIIKRNNLDLPNIKYRTYSSIIEKHEGELQNIKADYIILDEIHHLGAPIWGSNIEKLINTHPDSKILGMSAYTIRDRATAQERDMADPTTNEIFSNKIVSTYSLVDAMNDKVLPKPIYKSAYLNLKEEEKIIEEKLLKKNADNEEYRNLINLLNETKRKIEKAPSIKDIIKKNIKPNGKYIYFCPPLNNENTSSIEEIQTEAMKWFENVTKKENIIIYTSTSKMAEEGRKNREAFYYDKDLDNNDVKNKLRIMFAINQYNEGVHAPNIDGVIMGRRTSSDIVFFEQLGRALNVRENAKEEMEKYMSYSLRQLREECKKRELTYTDFDTDDILINKLTSPIIIDLVNNYEYIKELENNLRDKIKEEKKNQKRSILKLNDPSFDIEIENKNIHETLDYVLERINLTWNDYYEYAKKYYEYYNNLEIPSEFRTNYGYDNDPNGFIRLGKWIVTQRKKKNDGTLSTEKENKLTEISMRWNYIKTTLSWDEYYSYAKKFFEQHEHLEVPRDFKTDDGYTANEKGKIGLGAWIFYQRNLYKNGKLDDEKITKLIEIHMRFNDKRTIISFNTMIEYVNEYIKHNNIVDIPYSFKTNNGYDYDENGKIPLGTWVAHRKSDFYSGKLSQEKLDKLRSTGLVFDMANKKKSWDEMYQNAVEYFNKNGNLEISLNDENQKELKNWLHKQKTLFNNNKLDIEKIQKLSLINFNTSKMINTWEDSYEIAVDYYKENNTIDIPFDYKTKNGYSLGQWVSNQRSQYKNGELTKEKIDLLNKIGFNFNKKTLTWDDSYNLAKKHYEQYNTIDVKRGYIYEGYDLGLWISHQRSKYNTNQLSEDKINKLKLLNMRFQSNNPTWEEMFNYAKLYSGYYGNLEVPSKFKTNDGITEDKEGSISLGRWIIRQRFKYSRNELKEDKIRGLEKYGMIWNISKNIEKKKEILREYGINYETNKTILDKMPIQILESKIIFCMENKIPIKKEDNTLNDLFFISNSEFEKQYNISVFDLIDNYYQSNKRSI